MNPFARMIISLLVPLLLLSSAAYAVGRDLKDVPVAPGTGHLRASHAQTHAFQSTDDRLGRRCLAGRLAQGRGGWIV